MLPITMGIRIGSPPQISRVVLVKDWPTSSIFSKVIPAAELKRLRIFESWAIARILFSLKTLGPAFMKSSEITLIPTKETSTSNAVIK